MVVVCIEGTNPLWPWETQLNLSEVFVVIQSSMQYKGFPGSARGKEPSCQCRQKLRDAGLGRSPEEGHGNPLQLFMPGESHGQRSLAD